MAKDDPLPADISYSDLVDRAERLRQSADEAARLVRQLFITFVLFGLYIAIIIGSTTDVQLLKIENVKLPLLDIGLPIVGFYTVVPWLFWLVHVNLLLQFYLLARKLHAFKAAVEPLEPADRREQRERLFPFTLTHMLAGHQHSPLVKALLALVLWITMVILPLTLLIWADLRFLPFHDQTVTWIQRTAILADLVALWLFWPLIVTGEHISVWWRGYLRKIGYPLRSFLAGELAAAQRCWPGAALRPGLLARWRRMRRRQDWVPAGRGLTATNLVVLGVLVFEVAGFEADSLFSRNLDLSEEILVRGELKAELVNALREGDEKEQQEALKKVRGLNLQKRDLTGVNFWSAVLPKADLRGARLTDAFLLGVTLTGADLFKATLTDALLWDATLTDANLGGATLIGANLQEATLSGADLTGATLTGADLRGVTLSGTDLTGATLTGADLSGVTLTGANFSMATLTEADLEWATLTGANLERATLTGANLEKATLTGANLWWATVTGANLLGATLTDANLGGANLEDLKAGCASVLTVDGHKERCADFRGADLRATKLSGANLVRATLTGADLRMATLTDAILTSANLEGVKAGCERVWTEDGIKERCTDLRDADLSGARLSGADLRGAALTGANFQDAVLEGAKLRGVNAGCIRLLMTDGPEDSCTDFRDADLRRVNLSGADLRWALLEGAKLDGACGDDGTKLPPGFPPLPPCED